MIEDTAGELVAKAKQGLATEGQEVSIFTNGPGWMLITKIRLYETAGIWLVDATDQQGHSVTIGASSLIAVKIAPSREPTLRVI